MNAPGKINTDSSKFNIVISPSTMVDPSEMINILTTNEIFAIGLVKYITTGILSPFEVSRILQQIQYVPSIDYIKKNDFTDGTFEPINKVNLINIFQSL